MKINIKAEEINFAVYRYLAENGYTHSAFTFRQEAKLPLSLAQFSGGTDARAGRAYKQHFPPHCLLSLIQKGLIYLWIEYHTDRASGALTSCQSIFALFRPHVCRKGAPVLMPGSPPPPPKDDRPQIERNSPSRSQSKPQPQSHTQAQALAQAQQRRGKEKEKEEEKEEELEREIGSPRKENVKEKEGRKESPEVKPKGRRNSLKNEPPLAPAPDRKVERRASAAALLAASTSDVGSGGGMSSGGADAANGKSAPAAVHAEGVQKVAAESSRREEKNGDFFSEPSFSNICKNPRASDFTSARWLAIASSDDDEILLMIPNEKKEKGSPEILQRIPAPETAFADHLEPSLLRWSSDGAKLLCYWHSPTGGSGDIAIYKLEGQNAASQQTQADQTAASQRRVGLRLEPIPLPTEAKRLMEVTELAFLNKSSFQATVKTRREKFILRFAFSDVHGRYEASHLPADQHPSPNVARRHIPH